MGTLFVDVETYRNFFYIGIKRKEDGRRIGFEFSPRADFDRARVWQILRNNLTVGFNSLPYDLPMIYLALTGASNEDLKIASDRIIKGGLRWWEVEDALEIKIPKLDHIDLFEPNPAVRDGLKTLNGRLHGKRLQDLPYDEAAVLTHEQMDKVADYCLTSDLDATENLFDALKEPLELRVALGKQYGMDFRSKSDAQMGEAMIKKRVEALTGKKPERAKGVTGTSFRYSVPDFFEFETPLMQGIVETIRKTDFVIDKSGKVEFPKAFENFSIKLGAATYKMGIGGLHSTESCRAVHSDDDFVLVDADVASQYPRIIMKLGLYPQSLGKHFLPVYGGLIDDRVAAKRAGDKVKDKGGKIALNGAYGKLGSIYSVLYAPHLMIAVTLTGQLSLLMLIERAEAAGISVVSGNTDGVVFKVPRAEYEGIGSEGPAKDRLLGGRLKAITDWWEERTGFELEFAEYRSIYNRDVNTYLAIKSNGKAKRKGAIANHWHPDSPDYDPGREQMKKNPQMTICGDAVLAFLRDGVPIEQTIRTNTDFRGFVTVVKATGGGTWRDGYLGKVVRYYWSTDGDPIVKVKAHPTTGNRPKVSKTDGCRPAMTLPDEMPADIDYQRYIDEAHAILEAIGAPRLKDVPSPYERMVDDLFAKRIIT